MAESNAKNDRPVGGAGIENKPAAIAARKPIHHATKLAAGASAGTPTPKGVEEIKQTPAATLAPDYIDEALHLEQPEAAQPETEEEKKARWRSTSQSRKLAKKEANQTAIIIMALLDGLATMAFGASASMNETERGMLQEPMERILMRLDLTSSEALARWSDPVLLVMGLVAWGSRLMRERSASNPPSDNFGTDNDGGGEPKAPPPDNGRASEIIVTEQLRPPKELTSQIKGQRISVKDKEK